MIVTTPADAQKWATRQKILASTAVLAGLAAVAGMGAFALFTDSATAEANVDAGQLDIAMSAEIAVADIAPTDTIERPVTFTLPQATNDGDLVRAIKLSYVSTEDSVGTDPTVPGEGMSLLTGDHGLTYTLITCDGGTWTTSGTAPVGPYTCTSGGEAEVVTASGKLSDLVEGGTTKELTPAAFGVEATPTNTFPSDDGDVTLNALMRLHLPEGAGNEYENASTEFTLTGTALQRGGIQK